MDIVADILRIARGGVRKTKIVYSANLNFKLFDKYLNDLERANLVTKDPKNGVIKTTEKGQRYLYHYESILKDFGNNLPHFN